MTDWSVDSVADLLLRFLAGLPVRGLLRGSRDLGDLPECHSGDQLPGPVESPRPALEMSNVLRGLSAGRRLLPGHHSVGGELHHGRLLFGNR